MKRPCLEGDGLTDGPSRHPECQRAHDRQRRPTTGQRGYGPEWARYSRAQINEEPWCHSTPCPYPEYSRHIENLTTDHVDLGLVLCRKCNSSKQHSDRVRGVG